MKLKVTTASLAVSASVLFAGGEFTTAGEKASAHVAKAIINRVEFAIANGSPSVANDFFHPLLVGLVNSSVIIEISTTLTDWTPVASNTLPPGGWLVSFAIGTNDRGFCRARWGP